MSLLWTQAMAWMDHNPQDAVDLAAGRAGVPYAQRRAGYVKQIAQAHGVSEDQAHGALSHIEQHLAANPPGSRGAMRGMNVTDAGFASAPDPGDIYGKAVWHMHANPFSGKSSVAHVPLDKIHGGQHTLDPHVVLHNLFHPGTYAPDPASGTGQPGDPDVQPPNEKGRFHNEYATRPTVRRLPDGSLHAQDGHHRLAADMLLGKQTSEVHLADHMPRRGLFRGRPPVT